MPAEMRQVVKWRGFCDDCNYFLPEYESETWAQRHVDEHNQLRHFRTEVAVAVEQYRAMLSEAEERISELDLLAKHDGRTEEVQDAS